MWIGAGSVLSMLAPDDNWTSYTSANSRLTGGHVWQIVINKQGQVVAGTQSGLTIFDPAQELALAALAPRRAATSAIAIATLTLVIIVSAVIVVSQKPVATRSKTIDFLIGFIGCYVVNGAVWSIPTIISFIAPGNFGFMAFFWFLVIAVIIAQVLVIILAFKSRRFIFWGLLTAIVTAFLISLATGVFWHIIGYFLITSL
jgi:hypothetical protein